MSAPGDTILTPRERSVFSTFLEENANKQSENDSLQQKYTQGGQRKGTGTRLGCVLVGVPKYTSGGRCQSLKVKATLCSRPPDYPCINWSLRALS